MHRTVGQLWERIRVIGQDPAATQFYKGVAVFFGNKAKTGLTRCSPL